MLFTLGQLYTRQQIHEAIGGDLQSYLPHVGGRVVCGCFDNHLNKRAPFEIDVGNKPDVIKYAERVESQTGTIPVFMKRGSAEWEYVGEFSALKLERNPADLHPANPSRRKDAVAVLYLAEEQRDAEDDLLPDSPSDVEATEGQPLMRAHLARERSSILVEAKRRAFRSEHGMLRCEVCCVKESEFPSELSAACFEVHHLCPLSSLGGAAVTRLSDLAVVCANCHRMLHRSKPMLQPDALSAKLRSDA